MTAFVLFNLACLLVAATVPIKVKAVTFCDPNYHHKGVYDFAHGDTCYVFFYLTSKGYHDARDTCKQYHGSLAMPKSLTINTLLSTFLRKHITTSSKYWIGLSDEKYEGWYTWEDGTRLYRWDAHFPNGEGYRANYDLRHFKDCVSMDSTGNWYDYSCNEFYMKNNFICQFEIQPMTNSPTMMTTTPRYHLIPIDATGCERINDEQTSVTLTRPVVAGFRETCYAFYDNKLVVFDDAARLCRQEFGGMLAMSKSKEVNSFLTNIAWRRSHPDCRFWIGLSDEETEGVYRWSDGTKMDESYFKKNKGENGLNILKNYTDCVTLEKSGLWFDDACRRNDYYPFAAKHRFICEFKRSTVITTTVATTATIRSNATTSSENATTTPTSVQ